MQHFIIAFDYNSKRYYAKVQKIATQPVQFIVYNLAPFLSKLPQRLVFISNPKEDQLIFQSFDVGEDKMIRIIGENFV